MDKKRMLNFVKDVLKNMPEGWLTITTHRLDIYNEKLAKVQFLEQFEALYLKNNSTSKALNTLPTAYDYIRLGHPLSCLLEWVIGNLNNIKAENVISFSSNTVPILAILRKNLLANKNTKIIYTGELPHSFDVEHVKNVYGYNFKLEKVSNIESISEKEDNQSIVFISQENEICTFDVKNAIAKGIDFFLNVDLKYGSVLLINGEQNKEYISAIQHVRRRETIAMTPANSLAVLKTLVENKFAEKESSRETDKTIVLEAISTITGAGTKALVASSGLSIQYAILMGLIDNAFEIHKEKKIKIIVPPNCYGGTNDQARRVAACISRVDVVDLPVDGGNDMNNSIDFVLEKIAKEDAVPYIIAEIPTNPRVEVPNLSVLRDVLSKERKTETGETAIAPVFILDQTFCPNVRFLGDNDILSSVRTISFASGSKFPSGGLCTAGYCVGNKKARLLIERIEKHLKICDNEATSLQMEILAKQLPSMNQRISDAYKNTRDFVRFIEKELPNAKINFVSENLAQEGFTPSVFSLDLPTKGNTEEEREEYKRALNLKLINLMISEIPHESKFCVSYGQLKGCYWTIPATSTQGTTKEGDKDYIVRVALSPNLDLKRHKEVFLKFVESIKTN